MIRENPASRGTETSAEVLVGPHVPRAVEFVSKIRECNLCTASMRKQSDATADLATRRPLARFYPCLPPTWTIAPMTSHAPARARRVCPPAVRVRVRVRVRGKGKG